MSHLRTPVARAKGLGSAQDGTHHWIAQRLTAVALVPLCIWFVGSLTGMAGSSHAEFVPWLVRPVNTVLAIAFVMGLCWHSMLGIQVVVEDYLHDAWLKVSTLVLVKFTHASLAIIGVYAILRIGFRSWA